MTYPVSYRSGFKSLPLFLTIRGASLFSRGGIFRDDGLHLFHLRFHVRDQLELGAAAVEVMPLPVNILGTRRISVTAGLKTPLT